MAFVEIDGVASVTPKIDNITESDTNDGPGVSTFKQRLNAVWGLGRISHRNPGHNNYVYDESACKGTRIYIIDTGIRVGHTEFRDYRGPAYPRRSVAGANFIVGSPVSLSTSNTQQIGNRYRMLMNMAMVHTALRLRQAA